MPLPTNIHAPARQVIVTTTARLHMGFYDLSNNSRFGSLGLSLNSPVTQIIIIKSENTIIDVKSSNNVTKIVEKIVKEFNLKEHFTLDIKEAIPVHVGFGSGTQMALAIGAGLSQLFNLNLSVPQIVAAASRGKRSGIGIAAFMHGGMLVDAGKVGANLPEIALRQDFPESWRVLLITDSAHIGVHDETELQAFQSLKHAQGELRNIVFNHMMPALQRADLLAFGAYMSDLQAYNGDYFAPIQGGQYASQNVADVLHYLQKNGVACVGQSSWGPTGFAILESESSAKAVLVQLQQQFADLANLSFQIVRGKNSGASIKLG